LLAFFKSRERFFCTTTALNNHLFLSQHSGILRRGPLITPQHIKLLITRVFTHIPWLFASAYLYVSSS
jgi:hypothetical protein